MKVACLSILSLFVLFGCMNVTSPVPFGENVKKIDSSTQRLIEGFWSSSDGILQLHVVDRDRGIVKAGYWQSSPQNLQPDSALLYLRESGSWTIVSIRSETEKKNIERYNMARILFTERRILVWRPDGKKLADLVTAGIIAGKVIDGDVELGWLSSREIRLICSEAKGVLFEWDDPIILTKIQ